MGNVGAGGEERLDYFGLSGVCRVDQRGPAPVVGALEELGGAQSSGDVGSPAADEGPPSKVQCFGKRGGVACLCRSKNALGGRQGATHWVGRGLSRKCENVSTLSLSPSVSCTRP